MKALEKFFLRLNNREQTLLLLLYGRFFVDRAYPNTEAWLDSLSRLVCRSSNEQYQTIISLKPMIDSALEKQKQSKKIKATIKINQHLCSDRRPSPKRITENYL